MFFPKFLKLAAATVFFSNPLVLEALSSYRVPFTESTAHAQTVLTPSSEVAAKRWQSLTSQTANFTVLMPPGNPEQKTFEESTGEFKFQIQGFALPDENGIFYFVAYTDFLPFVPKSFTPEQAEVFYQAFTAGMLGELPEARVLSEREINLKGVPGREVEIQGPDNVLLKVRVFLDNSRIYMLMVGIPNPSLANSPNVAQFLNSFDWINRQAPVVSKRAVSKKGPSEAEVRSQKSEVRSLEFRDSLY